MKTRYYWSDTNWASADSAYFYAGLFPDDLPSRLYLQAGALPKTTLQRAHYEISSANPNMQTALVRFVNFGPSSVYVSNVLFYPKYALGQKSVDLNPFRYCGEYLDLETHNYYLRARYYNPVTARWLTEDPIRSGLNWYTYCSNKPLFYLDPFGLAEIAVRDYLEQWGVTVNWTGNSVKNGATYATVNVSYNGNYLQTMTGKIDLNTGKMVLDDSVLSAYINASGAAKDAASRDALDYHPIRDSIVEGVVAGTVVYAAPLVASGIGQAATAIGTALAPVMDKAGQFVSNTWNKITGLFSGQQTVLYSGGQEAFNAASNFAKQTGGTVIDWTSIGKAADAAAKLPGADFNAIWQQASVQFCQGANGVVNAFVYEPAYRGSASIFWNTEMPALLKNTNVTEIVIHYFGGN